METQKPNILILILDSARAHNMSVYGYDRDTTPYIETLSKEATTYTQARSPAGRSLPSHASIFTGYLPQEHRVNDLDAKISRGNSIFEWLSDRSYTTGLFTDNPYLVDLDTGLNNGFDYIRQSRDPFEEGLSPAAFVEEEGGNHLNFLRHALQSESRVKSVLNGLSWTVKWRFPQLVQGRGVFSNGFKHSNQFETWYEGTDEKPWAACINLMDTHVPFRPMGKFDNWQSEDTHAAYKRYDFNDIDECEEWKYEILEDRYDGTIRQADAIVETIVETLKETNNYEETLIIITSDHGEGFGERSPIDNSPKFGHGDAVDDILLHVPLIVKHPGQSVSKIVSNPVGLVDMPSVVKDAVEDRRHTPEFPTDRTVFAGGFENESVIDAAYTDTDQGVMSYVRRMEGTWTIHIPRPLAGYVIEDNMPDEIETAMESLDAVPVTTDNRTDIAKSTEQKLQALGYTE